ncbi:MAG: zinc-ribbon domain-containing protein [Elusimicrobiota bacterium]
MNITCKSCAAELNLPDDKIPQNIPRITVKCPKCQQPIVIEFNKPAAQAPAAAPPTEDIPQPAAPPPPAEPPPEEEFDEIEGLAEGDRLAMVCFDDSAARDAAKKALENLAYAVHTPAKPAEGVFWLRRYKYEVVLVHRDYGGSEAENPVLRYLRPLAMLHRREMCVGLVGKDIKTLDNMTAFAKSANFVIAEGDLEKLEDITRKTVADNDKFYRPFKEALREAGKV